MPKFIVEEVKEVVTKSEVIADNAHQALWIFKSKPSSPNTTICEQSNITVEISKEDK